MLSSILDFFRAIDPYLYKLIGRDMYVALDGAPTSCYLASGIALSAAVVIAFQAKKRLQSSADSTSGSTNTSRENSPSFRPRRASTTGSGKARRFKIASWRVNKNLSDAQGQDRSEEPDVLELQGNGTKNTPFIFESKYFLS